jgi:CheY-like chemotaxis protein
VEQPAVRTDRARISVLIASGDRPVLRMMSRFLATFPDVIVVGLADTMADALERVTTLNPDVLLLDHNLITPDDNIARAPYRRRLPTEIIALVDSTVRLNDANAIPLVVTKSRLAVELMPCIRRASVVRAARSDRRDAARSSNFTKGPQ